MTNTTFCGEPSALFPRLPGSHPELITTGKCHAIGMKLAEIHVLAEGTGNHRSNPYSSTWVNATLARVKDRLSSQDASLLHEIARHYALMEEEPDLPRGVIHGDLFRDNALFVDEDLTGIIDFYHACNDFLIQDIAITINDWCFKPQGEPNEELERALIEGYQTVRKITNSELQYLVTFQQFAALRFVLTRLISGEKEKPLKDPEEFLRIARRLKNRENGSSD